MLLPSQSSVAFILRIVKGNQDNKKESSRLKQLPEHKVKVQARAGVPTVSVASSVGYQLASWSR